jgi:hypothetical protein
MGFGDVDHIIKEFMVYLSVLQCFISHGYKETKKETPNLNGWLAMV